MGLRHRQALFAEVRQIVDADHYFTGTEAIPRANALARQWELLCSNWDQMSGLPSRCLANRLPTFRGGRLHLRRTPREIPKVGL